MHIPDGVLSPSTSAVAAVAMLPVWTLAAKRVRSELGMRQVPLLSLGAAFCFTVMMFNIPALGGTTAHPVAGTLLAILLGPWAAVIGISVALGIQALFFGDGGLLAFGANCFTMAFALPFVGYSVYRLLAGRGSSKSMPRPIAGAIGAYIGLNAAAAIVAVFLGIQPVLFHETGGHALYFPFGLNITLPAMLGTHLFVAGPAEAVVTALVVKYLQTAGIALYGEEKDKETRRQGDKEKIRDTRNKIRAGEDSSLIPHPSSLAIGLLALIALTPLGLLAKGDAWGEWDAAGVREQIKQVQGTEYVPQGIAQADEHGYKGIRGLQDYAGDKGKLAYAGAGLLGVSAIAALLLLGGRLLTNSNREEQESGNDDDQNHPGGNNGKTVGAQFIAPSSANAPDEQPNSQHPTPNTESLPDWLRTSPDAREEPPNMEGPRPNPFLERTLAGLAANARTGLQSEHWARQAGYLQPLDPRAKVACFLLLIVVVAGLHSLPVLLLLYALALLLAHISKLPASLLLKRVWLSVPIFVGALALPTLFSFVTPGRILFTLSERPLIAVTLPGLLVAATLTLRVGVAVTFASLLTLTTRWNDLLRALRILFVPRLFVLVLAMTYRYLAVLTQIAGDMFVARRSRTVGRISHAGGRGFVGGSMGALFGKTLALSEEAYNAMLARGFNGEIRTLSPLRWRPSDSAWTCAMLLVALLCVAIQ